jgi:transcriptional regulator of acetoin/glycerol metabolism
VVNTSETVVSRNVLLDLPFADAKKRIVDNFEREYMVELLRRSGGNVSEAARQAGLDRSNFRRVLKKHGVAGG